jgi:hypothetical protein
MKHPDPLRAPASWARLRSVLACCVVFALLPLTALAQSASAFVLQGELQTDGVPANGAHDFEARLFLPGDSTPADVVALEDVPVVDGIFVLTLEFPPLVFLAFTDEVKIELAVRPGASSDPHVVLGERVSIEPAPLAQVAQHVLPGSVGAAEIVPSQVQRRIVPGCLPNQAIRSVAEDGSVICDEDDAGISLVAGEGLSGGGNSGAVTLAADFEVMQRRVQGACAEGESIRAIAADGTVSCEVDDAGLGVAIQSGSTSFFGGSGTTVQPQATALCPTNWRAIGGGFDSNCPATVVHRSQPTPNGIGWFVQAVKPSTASCPNPSTLNAYAICVP